jgi:cytidine deaminase
MVVGNPIPVCEEAKLYYYDFILGEGHELIPEHIVQHINQCQNCREQLNELKVALSQADSIDTEQNRVNSATATMLQLHFAYIGKPVTCETVKPFLPTLLEPQLEVRIPTPITVHLDSCPECSEDLETIRRLNLNRKQLCRLSQLLADKSTKDKVSCSKAHAAILFIVLMTFRETDAEVLKHVCVCRRCRQALYEYRNAVIRDVDSEIQQSEFPCGEVSAADIFDYVVPYGFDPSANQYGKFRESLTSHLRRCPTCLAKMQQLHETVYAIADRADSEIATVYNIAESSEASVRSESTDLYKGFPISVDVIGPEKVRVVESPFVNSPAAVLRQKLMAAGLRPIIKTAIAVAAALLIGIGLLLNTPSAKAVTIEQIYKAIEKARNVYIASFVPSKKEPIQEQWVSRFLNIYMTKTGKELVLWDLQNKVRKTGYPDSNSVETTPLSAEVADEIGTTLSDFLALVPFANPSLLPKNAGWNQATDLDVELITKDIEVYDLTWTEKLLEGSDVFKKWRVFVDRRTNLPQRTEFYEKLPADGEYMLRSNKLVKYLSDSEIQTIIKAGAF